MKKTPVQLFAANIGFVGIGWRKTPRSVSIFKKSDIIDIQFPKQWE